MVDWQITAATLYCPFVADEATIIVNSDWTVRCTGYDKYAHGRRASVELVKRSIEKQQTLECQGLDCQTIASYKQKLKNEESAKATPAGDIQ